MKALLFTILVLTPAAVAQKLEPLPPVDLADFVNRGPQLCEDRSAMVDLITQRTPPDETITLLAHEGTSESRPNRNQRRLHNVRAYWTQFPGPEGRRKPETIILSEGERVPGYGRLEFYVRGKLVSVLSVAHNADVDFGDCVPPNDSYIRHRVFNPCWIKRHRIFYPCRDLSSRRKRSAR